MYIFLYKFRRYIYYQIIPYLMYHINFKVVILRMIKLVMKLLMKYVEIIRIILLCVITSIITHYEKAGFVAKYI